MLAATIREKLRANQSLPSLPAVAIELIQLCRDEEVDLVQIANRLAQDPVLAAKILRVANSAFYSGSGEVKTIRRAVSVLGSNTVMTLALSFALVAAAREQGGFDHEAFWRRALLCAIAARGLARRAGLDPEELFLASLFQDLGMLAMRKAFPDYGAVVAQSRRDHDQLEILEREKFGTNHAEVGALLAEDWKLPAFIARAVLGSHDPRRAPEGSLKVCTCVCLSSQVAEVWCGPNPPAASREAAAHAAEQLGLDGDLFWGLLTEVAGEFGQLSGLFEVRLDDEHEVVGILHQAKEALVEISLRASQRADSSESAVITLAREKREVEQRLQRDALTGLFARAHAEAALRLALASANEYARPASVLMLDVDEFKKVNDEHGHLVGDRVLKAIGQVLEASIRRHPDLVGRWGGEEFVVVLPGTDAQGARAVAERMRAAVEALRIHDDAGQPLHLTVSAGVATRNHGDPPDGPDALIGAADANLLQAKAAGRNRVIG